MMPHRPSRAVDLPTALQQHIVRNPRTQALGPLGLLACAGALWAATFTLVHEVTPPRPLVTPSLVLHTSTVPPKLVLALADLPTPQPMPSRRQQKVMDDVGAFFGHVARTLIQDQFDSILLKVSLGQQVVKHLEQDLLPPTP
mgnify:FL=1